SFRFIGTDHPLLRALLFNFCPTTCHPLIDGQSFGKTVRTIPSCLARVHSSIYELYFWKMVRLLNRIVRTLLVEFMESATRKDGRRCGSSFRQTIPMLPRPLSIFLA
ncbi:hypothetical protein HAX54_033270, partial [Datura stramonium]|nr:hypothetical protein [Datura stramonium]